MLIIIDSRLPEEAIDSLSSIGEVFKLQSDNIVYNSIQGHPDIFLLQMEELVIMAPNAPFELKEVFKKHRITFLKGKDKLGAKFPKTAFYNAVATKKYLIHKKGLTDSCILHENHKKQFIDVSQAYTRCNLLHLKNNTFITSDHGIEKSLKQNGINVHYFESDDVKLEGQDHGFIAGAMGVFQDSVFIIGSLSQYKEGEKLKMLIESNNMKIVELYNGPLIDGGGIFFLES